MSAPKRISIPELQECLKEGLGVTAISKKLGITKGAVSKRLKRMGHVVAKRRMTIYQHEGSGAPVNLPRINMIDQFVKINKEATDLLNKLLPVCQDMKGFAPKNARDPYDLCVKLMGEVRSQVSLWHEMEKTWINLQTVKEFVGELVQALKEEIGNDAMERVRDRIEQIPALRGFLQRTGLSDSASEGEDEHLGVDEGVEADGGDVHMGRA